MTTTSSRPVTTPLLTVRRTGGIAGFDDTVHVHPDGRVVGSSARRGERELRLTDDALATVTQALAAEPVTPGSGGSADDPSTSAGAPRVADGMTTTITTAHGTRLVDDGPGTALHDLAKRLLDGVTGPDDGTGLLHL